MEVRGEMWTLGWIGLICIGLGWVVGLHWVELDWIGLCLYACLCVCGVGMERGWLPPA